MQVADAWWTRYHQIQCLVVEALPHPNKHKISSSFTRQWKVETYIWMFQTPVFGIWLDVQTGHLHIKRTDRKNTQTCDHLWRMCTDKETNKQLVLEYWVLGYLLLWKIKFENVEQCVVKTAKKGNKNLILHTLLPSLQLT